MIIRATTVIAVRRGGETALAADGQVSIEDTIFKSGAAKLRKMRDGKVLVRLMPWRCSSGWRASWTNTAATSNAPWSSWPSCGAPTGPCASSRR